MRSAREMMKPRSSRVMGEQTAASSRIKAETLGTNGANQQQASAQARKRRSSINVYDQPSSLNSRLRQLETDMLRLDEDRTKLFDDTHSALAQYELKLSEIHAILKSRQDNVEKYVEDMKLLLQAKEEFEKQTKLLNDKHDRIHEKFMHRETIISREIKLLKNKFEILEKNRQFRSMLQKSNQMVSGDNTNDDLISGLDGSSDLSLSRKRSETTTIQTGELDSDKAMRGIGGAGGAGSSSRGGKSVRIKMSKLADLTRFLTPIFGSGNRRRRGAANRMRRKSNKVSSLNEANQVEAVNGGDRDGQAPVAAPSNEGADRPVSEASKEREASAGGEAPSFHLDSQSQQQACIDGADPGELRGKSEEPVAELQPLEKVAKRKGGSLLRRLFG